MALVFICGVVVLFAVLLIWKAAAESRKPSLHPAGLLRWWVSGNWPARIRESFNLYPTYRQGQYKWTPWILPLRQKSHTDSFPIRALRWQKIIS